MNSIFLPVLALLPSLASTVLAQENQSLGGELGRMWTFENPPLAYLEEEYGFKPDQEWLDSLRLGALRLGNENILSGFGSASFVSPNGLIMTSTRCVRDAVTETRPKDLEIINAGFVAAAQEQEFRLRWQEWEVNSYHDEWLTAAQLIRITTVTDRVNSGVLLTDNEIQIGKKREANKQTILDAATQVDPELVPQIVSLYQGAVVQLYQYKVYDDIRLVVLPPIQSAHFGGAADNFTYPRYSVDFAFLRAYENGEPADTSKHYFKWSSGGAKKDELVFVAGNPGLANRLRTTAQMELERDVRIPIEIERLTNTLRILKDQWSNNDPEFDPENPCKHWAWTRTWILATENDLKAARGHRHGLESATLMTQKTAAEQAFKSRVMADEKLARRYGNLWDRIAIVVEERRQHEVRARFQTADAARVFGLAVAVVRACDPAETAAEREQARKTVESWAGRTVHTNVLIVGQSKDHVVRSRSWLPADDPYFTKVLGGRNAHEFEDAVAGGQGQSPNWFGDPEPREALVNAGWTAIQESADPVIVAARELVPLMRENARLGAELDAREAALGAEMARALF
ncbi:MAG: S46 family peptidase, partial [Acidimicrobiia bacterium]|nr:S46 family peptidase [Acidimicrobiia bacterium]